MADQPVDISTLQPQDRQTLLLALWAQRRGEPVDPLALPASIQDAFQQAQSGAGITYKGVKLDINSKGYLVGPGANGLHHEWAPILGATEDLVHQGHTVSEAVRLGPAAVQQEAFQSPQDTPAPDAGAGLTTSLPADDTAAQANLDATRQSLLPTNAGGSATGDNAFPTVTAAQKEIAAPGAQVVQDGKLKATGGFQLSGDAATDQQNALNYTFWVGKTTRAGDPDLGEKPGQKRVDQYVTGQDLVNKLGQMSGQGLLTVQQRLVAAGYLKNVDANGKYTPETVAAYQAFLRDAAFTQANDANNKYTSPDDLLKQNANAAAGGGAKTKTVTDSQTALTSAPAAQQILKSAMAQYLGRDPSPAEVAQFVTTLNAAESANPTVTNTTTTTDGVIDPTTGAQSVKNQSSVEQDGIGGGGIGNASNSVQGVAENYVKSHMQKEMQMYGPARYFAYALGSLGHIDAQSAGTSGDS